MSEFPVHPVPANFADAHINADQYRAMYQRSVEDPDGFWSEMAEEYLNWDKPWDTVCSYDFVKGGRLGAKSFERRRILVLSATLFLGGGKSKRWPCQQ